MQEGEEVGRRWEQEEGLQRKGTLWAGHIIPSQCRTSASLRGWGDGAAGSCACSRTALSSIGVEVALDTPHLPFSDPPSSYPDSSSLVSLLPRK